MAAIGEEIAALLGPEKGAVDKFNTREANNINGIIHRLAEIESFIEEIRCEESPEQLEPMIQKLKTLYESIDNALALVAEVKQRLVLLEKEADKRKPSAFISLFKSKSAHGPVNRDEVCIDAQELIAKYLHEVISEEAPEQADEEESQ